MNRTLSGCIIFAFGAIIGVAASYEFFKTKYERIAQEEIDSVKEAYSDLATSLTQRNTEEYKTAKETAERAQNKPNIIEYAAKLHENGYTDYTKPQEEPIPMPDIPEENQDDLPQSEIFSPELGDPYVIAPEDFGEYDDYDRISLNYYADGVLADENGDLIDDVDSAIGSESLTHFGEFEEDSVYVRNPRLRCDYAIIMDERSYYELPERRNGADTEEE